MLQVIKDALKHISKLTLVMSLPLIILTVCGFFLIPFFSEFIYEVLSFSLLTLITISLILFFNPKALKRGLILLSQLLLSLIVFIKLYFYEVLGAKLSASSVFVFFETNKNEALEFMASYFNLNVFLLTLICLLPIIVVAFFLFINKRKAYLLYAKTKSLPAKVLSVLVIILAIYGMKTQFKDQSLFFVLSKSIEEYKLTKENIRSTLAKPISKNTSIMPKDNDKKTIVVIIGESTSKWHMQLYGYPRETNPLLTEIKDELFVFTNTIAPDVQTIRSIQKIFTRSSYDEPHLKNDFSLVQLGNQSNYSTTWISNQQPVGFTESIPTIIGSAAHTKKFISTDNYTYNIFDGDLLPYLNVPLRENKERKMIFIHLIGTHQRYAKRYPSSFAYFKGKPPIETMFTSQSKWEVINAYDNAVRYNDYVVRQIIEKIRSLNDNSVVIYFSDHGDDVYDTVDYAGHTRQMNSRPMQEVPFVIWFSKDFKTNNTFSVRPDEFYDLVDFEHTFSDLSNVTFEGQDSTKSIVNKAFKPGENKLNEIEF